MRTFLSILTTLLLFACTNQQEAFRRDLDSVCRIYEKYEKEADVVAVAPKRAREIAETLKTDEAKRMFEATAAEERGIKDWKCEAIDRAYAKSPASP